jgi:phosphoglycerol transferase MdoB-like AlkP superfamily enzyme
MMLDFPPSMMQRIRLPSRLAPALALAGCLLFVSTATRIALLWQAREGVPPGLLPYVAIFGFGFLYDLATAVYFVTPVVLALAVVPDRLARWHTWRALGMAVLFALTFLLVLTAVAEWLFWEEFGARFNFIAVDYLIYTQEVLGNIKESYPVGRIVAGAAFATLVPWLLLGRRVYRAAAAPWPWRSRAAWLLGSVGLALAFAVGLDQELKDTSRSDTVNELAGNGIYSFFAANRRNELDFERFYAALPRAEAYAITRAVLAADGGVWLPQAAGGVTRFFPGDRPRRLNVVLVSSESLGAEFLGSYGDRRGLTPVLDRLAQESLWFANAYATGNRTVRGLEALSLALPPTPGQSIVRRPHNEHLFSLGAVLEDLGYDVYFAYGGYGYFDNMNAFFAHNDYHVFDRTDMAPERIGFANVWGVADEYLFDEVLRVLDHAAEKARRSGAWRPFFMHIMTTSNHRPYTYPAGRIDIPSGSGREGAVKYADWAIGHLLAEARKRPWFDDTLFVITADHGANARGTLEIPVDKYRIPVFFYSPKHVAAQRVDRLMSQIDIPPTLLGLLGVSYFGKFFGRDMLHAPAGGDRAFVANYQTLGYLRDDKLVVLRPRRQVSVFRLDARGLPASPIEDPALAREAIALYQSAARVFREGLYTDDEQRPPR